MHVTLDTEVQAALNVLRITDGLDPRVLHVYSAVLLRLVLHQD